MRFNYSRTLVSGNRVCTTVLLIFLRNYNPGQSIWSKIEKSSKTGQDKKSLMSTFACFYTVVAKV